MVVSIKMGTEAGNNDQNFVISPALLGELICSRCEKYLSVGPIHSHTCGRCWSDDLEDVHCRKSGIEEIVSRSYFPCINRVEGCRKALRHYEVKEHERFCPVSYHICPICNLDALTAYKLHVHFKKNHSKSLTDNPEFEVSNSMQAIFMYYNHCNIFFVKVEQRRCPNTHLNRLYKTLVTVVPICSDYFARKISISLQPDNKNLILQLTSGKNIFLIKPPKLTVRIEIEYKTITNSYIKLPSEYNLNQRRLPNALRRLIGYEPSSRGWKLLKISGTKLYIFSPEPTKLLGIFEALDINLKCALCHQYFRDSLCNDPRLGSFVCGDCASIQNSELRCDEQATQLYSSLLIRCEARGCKKYYNLMMYLNLRHEHHCKYQRRMECPISICRWKGRTHEVTTHFETDHRSAYVFTDDTVLTFESILKMKVNYHSMVSVYVKLGKSFVQVICKQIKHFNLVNRREQVRLIKCYAYKCPRDSKVCHKLMKFSRENPVLKYSEATVEIRKGEGIKVIEKII